MRQNLAKNTNEINLPVEKKSAPAIRLALVSSGLGNVLRGFETSTARWYQALCAHTDWELRLFSGGDYENAKAVSNIPRDHWLLKPLNLLPFVSEQHRWELTYGIEQITFFPGLIAALIDYAPDAVWVKDVPLAHFLLYFRNTFRCPFKIIFANGGALRPGSYCGFDRIQQLHAQGLDEALAWGIPSEKMDLVSNCVISKDMLRDSSQVDRDSSRKELGLASTDWVVVCTAAWNSYHKRIDYLIDEIARISDPNVKLVLLGVSEAGTESLKELGRKKLGNRILWLTVPPSRVIEILRVADIFVLPSLNEGLGNALIEAALCGLPIICHPHGGARFVLGMENNQYWMTDLSVAGALASRLVELRNRPPASGVLIEQQEKVAERFSDLALAGKFESMVEKTLNYKSIQ